MPPEDDKLIREVDEPLPDNAFGGLDRPFGSSPDAPSRELTPEMLEKLSAAYEKAAAAGDIASPYLTDERNLQDMVATFIDGVEDQELKERNGAWLREAMRIAQFDLAELVVSRGDERPLSEKLREFNQAQLVSGDPEGRKLTAQEIALAKAEFRGPEEAGANVFEAERFVKNERFSYGQKFIGTHINEILTSSEMLSAAMREASGRGQFSLLTEQMLEGSHDALLSILPSPVEDRESSEQDFLDLGKARVAGLPGQIARGIGGAIPLISTGTRIAGALRTRFAGQNTGLAKFLRSHVVSEGIGFGAAEGIFLKGTPWEKFQAAVEGGLTVGLVSAASQHVVKPIAQRLTESFLGDLGVNQIASATNRAKAVGIVRAAMAKGVAVAANYANTAGLFTAADLVKKYTFNLHRPGITYTSFAEEVKVNFITNLAVIGGLGLAGQFTKRGSFNPINENITGVFGLDAKGRRISKLGGNLTADNVRGYLLGQGHSIVDVTLAYNAALDGVRLTPRLARQLRGRPDAVRMMISPEGKESLFADALRNETGRFGRIISLIDPIAARLGRGGLGPEHAPLIKKALVADVALGLDQPDVGVRKFEPQFRRAGEDALALKAEALLEKDQTKLNAAEDVLFALQKMDAKQKRALSKHGPKAEIGDVELLIHEAFTGLAVKFAQAQARGETGAAELQGMIDLAKGKRATKKRPARKAIPGAKQLVIDPAKEAVEAREAEVAELQSMERKGPQRKGKEPRTPEVPEAGVATEKTGLPDTTRTESPLIEFGDLEKPTKRAGGAGTKGDVEARSRFFGELAEDAISRIRELNKIKNPSEEVREDLAQAEAELEAALINRAMIDREGFAAASAVEVVDRGGTEKIPPLAEVAAEQGRLKATFDGLMKRFRPTFEPVTETRSPEEVNDHRAAISILPTDSRLSQILSNKKLRPQEYAEIVNRLTQDGVMLTLDQRVNLEHDPLSQEGWEALNHSLPPDMPGAHGRYAFASNNNGKLWINRPIAVIDKYRATPRTLPRIFGHTIGNFIDTAIRRASLLQSQKMANQRERVGRSLDSWRRALDTMSGNDQVLAIERLLNTKALSRTTPHDKATTDVMELFKAMAEDGASLLQELVDGGYISQRELTTSLYRDPTTNKLRGRKVHVADALKSDPFAFFAEVLATRNQAPTGPKSPKQKVAGIIQEWKDNPAALADSLSNHYKKPQNFVRDLFLAADSFLTTITTDHAWLPARRQISQMLRQVEKGIDKKNLQQVQAFEAAKDFVNTHLNIATGKDKRPRGMVKTWLDDMAARRAKRIGGQIAKEFATSKDSTFAFMLRSYLYSNYIGALGLFRVGPAIRNLTQLGSGAGMVGVPWLLKGMTNLYEMQPYQDGEGNWKLRLQVNSLLNDLKVTELAFTQSITESFRTQGLPKMVKGLRLTGDMLLAMFKYTEWINRAATGLGSFHRSRSEGVGRKQAIEKARRDVAISQFDFARGLGGTGYTGSINHLVFQFGRFQLYQTDFLAKLMYHAATGDTTGLSARDKGIMPALRMVLSGFAMSYGLQFMGDAMGLESGIDISETKSPAFGTAELPKLAITGFGDSLARTVARRNNLRTTETVLRGRELLRGAGLEARETTLGGVAESMAGPAVAQVLSGLRVPLTKSGAEKDRALAEWYRSFKTVFPGMQVSSAMRFERELSEGQLRTERTDQVLFPISGRDAFARMLGLTTGNVSAGYDELINWRARESQYLEMRSVLNEEVKQMLADDQPIEKIVAKFRLGVIEIVDDTGRPIKPSEFRIWIRALFRGHKERQEPLISRIKRDLRLEDTPSIRKPNR